MHIKKYFILFLIVIIQLSFTGALNVYHSSEYSQTDEKNPSSADLNSSIKDEEFSELSQNNLKESDPREELHENLDILINHIIKLTEKIKNNTNLANSNHETKRRPTRSDPPEGFDTPSSNDSIIEDLQIQLIKLTAYLDEMENSTSNSDTNQRIRALETVVSNLQTQIDNVNRDSKEQLENLKHDFDLIKSDVAKLWQNFNQIKQQEQTLRTEIINDIKGRDFVDIETKLRKLDGDLKRNINLIVHDVYANNAGNFNILLLFGKSENLNVTTRWMIYKALAFEMQSNGHKDYRKILSFIESLNIMLDIKELDSETKSDIATLKQNLYNNINDIVMEKFVNATKSNDYNSVSEIFERIQKHDPELFEVGLKNVLSHKDSIDVAEFDNVFKGFKNLPLRVSGYLVVLNELKLQHKLEQPAVVTLVLGLHSALYDEEPDLIPISLINEGLAFISQLPPSIRHATLTKQ